VLMNQHPHVHCPSEPWLMLALEAIGRTPDSDPSDAAVLYHAMAEFLTGDLPITAARAYARTAYNAKLAEAGKTIFVDKTPRYYLILPFIHRVFPKAKYVLLLRDPMDVAASMKQTWNFDLRDEFEHHHDALGSVDLNYGLRQMMAFACDPSHPAYFVRYEELVREPREKMLGVFSNVGVDPALAPADASFDVGQSSFARSAVGDRKILNTKGPHQKSIGGWKRVFDKDEAAVILNAIGPGMLRDLGYAATVDDAAAMGIELQPESHALEHFQRLHRAVMNRVHKYTACASFADLLSARAAMEAELGGKIPLDPLARVQMLHRRARELNLAAMSPDAQATAAAVAVRDMERRHARETEHLRRQLADEQARSRRLAASLRHALDTIAGFDAEYDAWQQAYQARQEHLQYWINLAAQLSQRLRFMIDQWPLKLAWKLRLTSPPEWAPVENHPLQLPPPDNAPLSPPQHRTNPVTPPEPLEVDPMTEALGHLRSKGFEPRVVLDIGAAKGYWSEIAQYRFFPDADYYMIDPLKQSEEHLSELAGRSPRFHYLLMAIGKEPGTLTINVGNDPDASSLLSFGGSPAQQQEVVVETINRLIEQGKVPPPQMVKIDVQGFEMEVLEGGQKMFDTAEVFIIEVNLFEFMPGMPLVDRIVTYMADKGYRVFDIAGTLRRPYQDDLAQMDLVFVKNDSVLVSSNQWK
jgi:FkbM family methyltransferase